MTLLIVERDDVGNDHGGDGQRFDGLLGEVEAFGFRLGLFYCHFTFGGKTR